MAMVKEFERILAQETQEAQEVVATKQESEKTVHITERDLALIRQICLPYKVLCESMGISHGNLRFRVTILVRKFGVENRTSLAVKAIKMGLVRPDEFQYRNQV